MTGGALRATADSAASRSGPRGLENFSAPKLAAARAENFLDLQLHSRPLKPVFISNARRQKKWVSTPYVSWAPKTERDLTMSTTTNKHGKIHYEEIDPNELVIGDNVRDNADQGPEFEELVTSIKETGHIYQPINAVIGADGARVVTDGQRRTLAARRLGLTTVPVRVLEPVAATDKQRTAERVTEQLVTAITPKGLNLAQKAKAVQELLLADVTPTKVAKVTGFKKDFVNAAAQVVKSTKAMAALDEDQLTMEQAVALMEFEDDDEAVEYLKQAATEGQFEHRASELRQRKAAEAAYAEHAKPHADKGFTVLPYDFRYWQSELDIESVENLFLSLDDEDHREASIETIEGNPQLWAVHISEQECYVDTRTDTVVDENLISWDLDDKPDEEPANGRIHPKHVEEADRFLPEFYCMDTAAAGVFTYEERLEARRAKNPKAAAETASESGQERNTAEDAAKAERRKVLQLNRLGEAAQAVRRTWVRERLLSRKTPPKGAGIFLAQELAAHPDTITDYRAADMAAELLGTSETGRSGLKALTADLAENADPRAVVVILGLLLGAMEAQTAKDSWRGGYYGGVSKRYLRFLVDNGYEAAPVEQVILGETTSDDLFAQVDSKRVTAADEDQDTEGAESAEPEADVEDDAEVA